MDPNADPYGDYPSHPLILHNVEVIKFKQFFWVFYNPWLSIYENSIINWDYIIQLAVLWGFDKVHALAAQEIYKLEEPFCQEEIDYAYLPEDLTDHATVNSDFRWAKTPIDFKKKWKACWIAGKH